MFPRSLDLPKSSFFLFGPRGTGKSTWVRDRLAGVPLFDLRRSLEIGHLPSAQTAPDVASARAYLKSYVQAYLREEVQQEGLARNLASFGRFLEAASFSQASYLNVSAVARECHVDRKVV